MTIGDNILALDACNKMHEATRQVIAEKKRALREAIEAEGPAAGLLLDVYESVESKRVPVIVDHSPSHYELKWCVEGVGFVRASVMLDKRPILVHAHLEGIDATTPTESHYEAAATITTALAVLEYLAALARGEFTDLEA